jgi:hypothetical protein
MVTCDQSQLSVPKCLAASNSDGFKGSAGKNVFALGSSSSYYKLKIENLLLLSVYFIHTELKIRLFLFAIHLIFIR